MSEKIGERHAGHSRAGDFNWHFLFHRQESRVVEGRGWISAERSFSTLAVKFLCEGFMERDHSCPGIIYIVGERAARVPRWFKSLHSTVAPYFICIQNALRDVHPLSLSSTPLCTNANCTRLYPCRYSGAYYYRGEKKIFNVWQKTGRPAGVPDLLSAPTLSSRTGDFLRPLSTSRHSAFFFVRSRLGPRW